MEASQAWSQHGHEARNALFSWGRAGSGRLGRSTHSTASSSSESPRSVRAQSPPSRRRRSVDVSGYGGSERWRRERSDVSEAPHTRDPDPSQRHLPGEVTADWSYRVNDHRMQGARLVIAPPPPSRAPGSFASPSPDSAGEGGRGGYSASRGLEGGWQFERVGRGSGAASVGQGPVSIAAGWKHSVAVTGEGAVFVWGCGRSGRLGLGDHVDVYRPRQVRGSTAAAPSRAFAPKRTRPGFPL